MTAEETWRLFSCQWCGLQVRLCRWCDRGQHYCGSECAVAQRQEAQRAASAAYQQTERGTKLHATRMQRYRDRHRAGECKFLAKIVTQQSSTQDFGQAMKVASKTDTEVRLERAEEGPNDDASLAMHAARDAARSEAATDRPGAGRSAQGPAEPTPQPPACAVDDARRAEPVERASAVRCTACGRALPARALLDALRRRAVARRERSGAVRSRAPRPPRVRLAGLGDFRALRQEGP